MFPMLYATNHAITMTGRLVAMANMGGVAGGLTVML